MRRYLLTALLLGAVVVPAAVVAQAEPPKFSVLKKIPIPGDGGWDYLTLDAASHRLFISRGTVVQVLDVESGKMVGEIANTPGVHGIALIANQNKGFTSNGRENTVTVFDLDTLKERSRIKVGENPDAIIYDGSSKKILTMNGRSSDATVIDPATEMVVGTVKLSGKPEFAAGDGNGHVFVNIEDKSTIAEIDVAGLKVVNEYPIAPGEEASGLAMDRRNGHIFSVCSNNLMTVMDAKTGKIIGSVKIGNGPDAAAYDSQLGLAFSPNGQDGTLSIVQQSADGKYTVIQEVATQKSGRTMAYDRRAHTAYIIAADFDAPTGGGRGKMKPGSTVIVVVGPAP